MAASDAKPIPQKNVAYRVVFPIYDADGDLVTGAAGLDSEVSKDQGTFADCTNEATEIATSSGMYYLDLTSTEMNADCVAVIVKTSTSGAKTTVIVLYPEEAGDIRVNVTQFGSTNGTFSGGRPEVNSTHFGGSALTQSGGRPEVNTSHVGGSAIVQSGGRPEVKVASMADNSLTQLAINDDAFSANKFQADTSVEIATAVWSLATRTLTSLSGNAGDIRSAVGLASANLDTQLGTIAGYIDTEIAAILAAVDTEVAAIKTVTDAIPDGGALTSVLGALATIDTVVDAIQVKTDNLPTDPADQSELAALIGAISVPALADIADAVLDEEFDGGYTMRQMLKLAAAVLVGVASGMGTDTATFRDIANTKNRVQATVDAYGNRSNVVLDVS